MENLLRNEGFYQVTMHDIYDDALLDTYYDMMLLCSPTFYDVHCYHGVMTLFYAL